MSANPIKTLEVWSAQYGFFRQEAPEVTYAYTHVQGLLSQKTSVSRPLPNGRVEVSIYEGDKIQSKSSKKNGYYHGESIIYAHEWAPGQSVDMSVDCYRNGEIYQATPCDVD